MKKTTMKQSILCNIMAGISIFFGVVIFASGVITSQVFFKVTNLNNDQKQIYSDMRALVSFVNHSKDMVRSYSQEGNTLYMDMYNKALAGEKTTATVLEGLKALVPDPNGQAQLAAIVAQIDTMTTLEKQAIALTKENKLQEARAIVFGKDYGTAIDTMRAAIDEFEFGMDRGIGSIIERQSNTVMYLGFLILFFCILLVIVQITNAITTKKMIIQPVIKLKDSMVSMNEGHLTGSVDVAVDNTEIGMLAGAMYSMRSRIDEYIKEISFVLHCIAQKSMLVDVKKEYVGDFSSIKSSLLLIIDSLSQSFGALGQSTDGILCSAEQVSHAAQSLADGATVQASSVEELSASINEITDQLKNTAVNAETAKTLAITSEKNLSVSNQQMSHMIQAISEISNSSAQISKIIKTIEDIAFQTNILALNAAVEAARAGAAGKGFAVVADETARALTEVVESSQTMATLVSKISQASSEQAIAIAQINQGVEQISSVVQTNSATSEQCAATSEDLSNQAQGMKNLVSSFKIKSTAQSRI